MGIDGQANLFRLLDTKERPVMLPQEGVVLSDKLAEILEVRCGDLISIHVLEGKRKTVELQVSGIVTEFGGLNAYMDLPAIQKLTGEGPTVSGAFISVAEDRVQDLYQSLKNAPRVAGVTIKSAALESFEDTIAENILMMRTFNILFAVIIAFGVVYNSARISLSEQNRDLATMRVMGFSQGEVSVILLGELAILTLMAIPVGWGLGYGLVAMFVKELDTEVYRIPLVINRETFFAAAVVVILAALVSAMVVQRQIKNLDLIGVLKTRE
jgi:putative ABC transport system permease protein